MRRIALLVTLAATLSLVAAAQAAAPDGLLAYSDGHSVFSVPPDGSAPPHRIGAGTQPEWSRDGKRIAWHGPGGVWVAAASGAHAKLVIRGASNPTWSPKATRLAYIRKGDLWTARPDGSAVRILARSGAFQPGLLGDGPQILNIAWSPDGKRMAVAAGAAGSLNFEVNVSLIPVDHHVRSVAQTASIADGFPDAGDPGNAVSFGWLGWSPDSTTVATGGSTWGASADLGTPPPRTAGPYTALVPVRHGAATTYLAPPVPGLTHSGYAPDGKRLCGISSQGLAVFDLATQAITSVAAPLAGDPDFTCSWSRPQP